MKPIFDFQAVTLVIQFLIEGTKRTATLPNRRSFVIPDSVRYLCLSGVLRHKLYYRLKVGLKR